MSIASDLVQRFEKLRSQRTTYETTWDEISEFVLPHRGDFRRVREPGHRRNRRLYDTTAVQANEFLASTLHGGLTNPSTKWFGLKSSNAELNSIDLVQAWLEAGTDRIFDVLNSPESNFQSQNHELFLDLVAYGTACMFIDDTPGEPVTFKAVHLSEIYIAENKRGHIDTVFRKFKFTARQAAQFWGVEKLPNKVKKSLDREPDRKFDFLHCVKPNQDYTGESRKATKLPFISYYICLDDVKIVDTSGFHEMPYLVPRWAKIVSEIYGRSPAWSAMADIRLINVMSKTLLVATEKAVDPPLLMADDGVMMPLRTMPGGINFGGLDINGQARIQPLPGPGRIDIGLSMMEERAKAIRNAYFIDPLMNSPIKSNVTREEILQRQEEKLRLIGPQVGRLQTEYLNPLIERLYGILSRRGIIPALPDEVSELVEGEGLDIEYTATLAQTHRSGEPIALQRTIQSFLPMVQLDPSILDNVDMDASFRSVAEILGVPNRMLKSVQDRDALRQARAQQQQQAEMMAAMNEGANTVANMTRSGVFDEAE